MTFKTLLTLRGLVVDQMLKLDDQIEELNEEAKLMKENDVYIDPGTGEYTPAYEHNRNKCRDARRKHGEMVNILEEIDKAELK